MTLQSDNRVDIFLTQISAGIGNLALIHHWSKAEKAQFIVVAASIIQALIVLIAGSAYIFEPDFYPFDRNRNGIVVSHSLFQLLLLMFALIPVRLAIHRRFFEAISLWVTIFVVAYVLVATGCLLGIFESLTWIIYIAYLVIGFIILGPKPVLVMFVLLYLGLVIATNAPGILPFPIYLYALPGASNLESLSTQMVNFHWAMASLAAGISASLMSYLLGSSQSREKMLLGHAKLDPLTCVLNRRAIMEGLELEISRAERNCTSLSVAMIDIDHFKQINDKYGHLRGDAVLVHIANLLEGAVRQMDMVGRYGGEEFLLVFPDCDLDRARTILDRIAQALCGSLIELEPGEKITVTVSAGIAQLGKDFQAEAIIDRADQALYLAKASGRNCIKLESAL